jgi:hypothetical protein
VKWAHRDWSTTAYYENDRNVNPNWQFEDVLGDIFIRIYDYDYPDADDHCDASPANGRKELQINFDPRRLRTQAIPADSRSSETDGDRSGT